MSFLFLFSLILHRVKLGSSSCPVFCLQKDLTAVATISSQWVDLAKCSSDFTGHHHVAAECRLVISCSGAHNEEAIQAGRRLVCAWPPTLSGQQRARDLTECWITHQDSVSALSVTDCTNPPKDNYYSHIKPKQYIRGWVHFSLLGPTIQSPEQSAPLLLLTHVLLAHYPAWSSAFSPFSVLTHANPLAFG